MLAGALLALSPVPFAIAGWAWRAHDGAGPGWFAMGLTIMLLLASLLTAERPRAAVALIFVALLGSGVLLWPAAQSSPTVALLALLGLSLAIDALWRRRRGRASQEPSWRAVARGALAGTSFFWLATALSGWQREGVVVAAVFASQGVALVLLLPWLLRQQRIHSAQGLSLLGALALAVLVLLTRWGHWPSDSAPSPPCWALPRGVFGGHRSRGSIGGSRCWRTRSVCSR